MRGCRVSIFVKELELRRPSAYLFWSELAKTADAGVFLCRGRHPPCFCSCTKHGSWSLPSGCGRKRGYRTP